MTARKHHYLPVWYLAGFTPSGQSSDHLWVIDLQEQRVRSSLPGKVACQRDLYSVNSVVTELDLFEHELGRRDSADAKLVRGVCQSPRTFFACLDALLEFAALIYVRSPNMRAQMTRWVEQHAGLPLEIAVEKPESWIWLAERLVVPLQAVMAAVGTCAGAGARTQAWHVLAIDVLKRMMLRILASKKWSLCVSQHGDAFVCSGSPLAVSWPEGHPSETPPRFADAEAVVTFPLDRSTALVAGLHLHHGWGPVGREAVAAVNSQTLLSLKASAGVQQFVFAPSKQFYCQGNSGLLEVIGTGFALVNEPADPR
jgi:hypothetical protein